MQIFFNTEISIYTLNDVWILCFYSNIKTDIKGLSNLQYKYINLLFENYCINSTV